jgi:hypothetical protein
MGGRANPHLKLMVPSQQFHTTGIFGSPDDIHHSSY